MRRMVLAAAAALVMTTGLAAGQTTPEEATADVPATIPAQAGPGGSDPMLAGAMIGTFAGVLIIFLLAASAD